MHDSPSTEKRMRTMHSMIHKCLLRHGNSWQKQIALVSCLDSFALRTKPNYSASSNLDEVFHVVAFP
jgi:hypothetical protein